MNQNFENKDEPLPEPWYWQNTELFERELQLELPNKHILKNKNLKSIAHSRMRDDCLFEILNDAEYKYAMVHLTWSKSKEQFPDVPETELFRNWDSVYEIILSHHADYNSE